MSIEFLQGNLFDTEADGLILTVDGAAAGLEGNIARAFARAYPDAWEELEEEIQFPISLESAKIYPLDTELGCPFRYVIFASTLHHIETLTESEKIRVVQRSLSSSLSLASSKLLGTLSCGLMSGGWRLDLEHALEAMIETYGIYASDRDKLVDLKIHVLTRDEFDRIANYLSSNHQHFVECPSGFKLTFS